jgi:hypothetical protein
MSHLSPRRALLAGASLALVGSMGLTANASAAPASHYAFAGGAYGSSAQLGSLVRSGQTSVVTMCTTKNADHHNSIASVNLGAAGSVGGVSTTITGSDKGGVAKTVTTSKTGAVKLLGGIISADAITSQAVAQHTSSGYKSSGTTKIANLRIAGVKIAAKPAKNSTIKLPAGLGSVTLNKQVSTSSLGRHQTIVSALSVKVNNAKLLGLPSGTITLGHANAMLHDPVHVRPSGYALASQVKLVNGAVTSGPTAVTNLPCGGTTGKKMHNDTAKVSVPGVLSVAAAGTTGQSTDSSSATSAKTSATTGAVSLLGGKIKLDAITVKASASQQAGHPVSLSSAGTKVAQLEINGKPVTVKVKENTKINIAGLGTLWLDKTTRSKTQIKVWGLKLELLKATAGLKAGAVITVGYARAGVSAH